MNKTINPDAILAGRSPLPAIDKGRLLELAALRGLSEAQVVEEALAAWMLGQEEAIWFEERRKAADPDRMRRLLDDTSRGEAPRPGDEIPESYRRRNS